MNKLIIFLIGLFSKISFFFDDCADWLNDFLLSREYKEHLYSFREAYPNVSFAIRREKFILRHVNYFKNITLDIDAISVMNLMLREYEDFLSNNGGIIPKFHVTSKVGSKEFNLAKRYSCELEISKMTDDLRAALEHLRFQTQELPVSKDFIVDINVEYKEKDQTEQQ